MVVDDAAKSAAETDGANVDQVGRKAASIRDFWRSNVAPLDSIEKTAEMQMLQETIQDLESRVQDLQTRFDDSEESRVKAQNDLHTAQQEQKKLKDIREEKNLFRQQFHTTQKQLNDVQMRLSRTEQQLQDALQAKQTILDREKLSRDAHEKELEEKRATVQALQEETVRLNHQNDRTALNLSSKEEELKEFEKGLQEALRDQKKGLRESFAAKQKQALQEQEKRLRESFDRQTQQALRDQEQKLEQLQSKFRGEEVGRQLAEQECTAAEHALAEAFGGLEIKTHMFEYNFPESHSLEQRATKLAYWAKLRVSRLYRPPIERMCERLDIKLDAWPEFDHAKHNEQMASLLDRIVYEVMVKFRDQDKRTQIERAHWLTEIQSRTHDAFKDTRSLERMLDADERREKDVEQHFRKIDGEGGILEQLILMVGKSRFTIKEQKRRIVSLDKELEETEALAQEHEQMLEEQEGLIVSLKKQLEECRALL